MLNRKYLNVNDQSGGLRLEILKYLLKIFWITH
jgi:hypothetical protein